MKNKTDQQPQNEVTRQSHSGSLAFIPALAAMALIVCLFFVAAEGLSSTAISIFQLLSYTPPPEISQYDESIGWIGVPDVNIPDAYGPGKYVRTNSLGFRNDKNISPDKEATGVRIICSGDSFTFGQGVANNHAWCNRLPLLNDNLETVNMAQPGYGVDQMYLRYRRDGISLEHSIHIFAFIVGDLDRMSSLDQHQYGKPVMAVDGERLLVQNVPVPRMRWTLRRYIDRGNFRMVEFLERGIKRLFRKETGDLTLVERTGPVASMVLQTIQAIGEAENVVPVFVLLPTERDLRKDHPWRLWVTETMEKQGSLFIDLVPALRAVPSGNAASFFIPQGMEAGGHYSDAGNEWVAQILYRRLTEIPQISMLLHGTGSHGKQP